MRMQPNWLLVGYTPLGAGRLGERDRAFLDSCEFPSAPPSEGVALVKELVCAPEGPQTPSSILHSSARGGIPSWGTFPIWYGNLTSSESHVHSCVRAISSSSEDDSESSIDTEALASQINARCGTRRTFLVQQP